MIIALNNKEKDVLVTKNDIDGKTLINPSKVAKIAILIKKYKVSLTTLYAPSQAQIKAATHIFIVNKMGNSSSTLLSI